MVSKTQIWGVTHPQSNLPKNPGFPLEPGSYKEALLNFRAAILLDHPEEKLSLQDINLVLAEVEEVFRDTPYGGRPLLRSYRLERGILFYACAVQLSVDGLLESFMVFKLGKERS
jgi:hypothetical protein